MTIFLVSILTFTACNDFLVGQSIQIGGNVNDPQFITTGPARVNISETFDIMVSVDRHTSSKPFAGFEFDLNYSGAAVTYNGRNYEGFFTGVASTDYFCVPVVTSVSGQIRQNACAGINQANTQAVADTYSFTFTPNELGIITFDVDSEIIANQSILPSITGEIQLQSSIPLSVEVCLDFDDDGFYTTACGSVVDCQDDNGLVNPGRAEICDNIDNNCNGLIDTQELGAGACDGFAPSVDTISFGLNSLSPNEVVSGTNALTITYSDTQDGGVPGDNMNLVQYNLIDSQNNVRSLGSSSNKGSGYSVNWNTALSATPDGIYTLEAIATDLTGYSGSLSIPIEIDNAAICEVTSLSWATTIVNEGEFVNLNIVGASNECDGKEYVLSYYENDGGTYAQITNPVVLNSYPASITFNTNPTNGVTTATAFWFKDNVNDGDFNPEVRARITDDLGNVVNTNADLNIINPPPTLTVSESSVQETTAEIVANTPNDPSTYTLEYTTTQGSFVGATVVNSPADLQTYTFSLSGLDRRTTYYYRVTATDIGEEVAVYTADFTTTALSADFNGDGKVDIIDLTNIVLHYRLTTADGLWDPLYDIAPATPDGIINILDLTTVALFYTG